MPWEITDKYIRSGHRNQEEFQPETMRTITLSEEEGIKAVIGKPKGKETMEVQSYLFDLSKGWTLEKAKEWFEKHSKNEVVRKHFSALLPFHVMEKIVDKPLRIRGIALTAGMSRNMNTYNADELKSFADKLVGSPAAFKNGKSPLMVDVIFSDTKLKKRAGKILGISTFYQKPEDLILAKLRMIKATVPRERALKDEEDVKAILKFTRVDLEVVKRRAGKENTLAILKTLMASE